MCELPPALRQTLTLDNGSELAGARELERAGIMPLLLQPYSPWQRGTNENGGGLLRQYCPRGISLHKITEKQIRNAVERLHKRSYKW